MTHVAVIGAGIVGLLTALELRERGHRVELHSIGVADGATYAAAGMLAPVAEIQHGQPALWRIMRDAAERHRDLARCLPRRTARPTGYRDGSTLVVGRDHADARTLRDLARTQRGIGAHVRELRPAEARLLEPALAPAVSGAVLVDGDSQVDPRLLAAAVEDALVSPGYGGPPVTMHVGRVASTDDVTAERVVVAAGLGATGIDGPHRRLRLPLRSVRGDILRLRVPDALLAPGEGQLVSRTVRAVVRGRPVYLVPRDDAQLVVGATSREDDLVGTSTGGVLHLLQDAAEIVPSIRETELVEIVTRDRPGTPDDLPLLGPVPRDERVIVSTGYSRHGILLSAWAAQRTADLVDGVQTDLAAVRPDRFTTFTTRFTAHDQSTGDRATRDRATRDHAADDFEENP